MSLYVKSIFAGSSGHSGQPPFLQAHMRQVFLDYDARPTPKTGRFCVRCQRDLKPEQPARIVRVLGAMVLHPDDAGDAGEDFLIGLNCAKKLGLEFTRPETPNAEVSGAHD